MINFPHEIKIQLLWAYQVSGSTRPFAQWVRIYSEEVVKYSNQYDIEKNFTRMT